eukprot:jgi/Tetstr1/433056/TSEL_022391.t1
MPSLTFRHPPISKSASDDILTSQKILLTSCGSNQDVVRKAICADNFHQAAKMNGIGEWWPATVTSSSSLPRPPWTPSSHLYLIFSSVLVFKIPGRPFPEDVILSKTPQTDFSYCVEDSVKQALLALHPSHGAGDVLIYITGRDEMETTCVALQCFQERLDQLETSLTVDGIIYVSDSSCCKFKLFPASQAAANHHLGRAAPAPATAFPRRAPSATRGELLASVPEVHHTSLVDVRLLLRSPNVANLLLFEFMDPRAPQVRTHVINIPTSHKIPLTSCGSNSDVVLKAIWSMYFYRGAKMKGIGECTNCRTSMPRYLHPSSALYGLSYTPDCVCFHELVMSVVQVT